MPPTKEREFVDLALDSLIQDDFLHGLIFRVMVHSVTVRCLREEYNASLEPVASMCIFFNDT